MRVVRNDWSSVRVPELGQWTPTLRVSVVVPAYDCQPGLDLVLAALARQSYPPDLLEVVVVDDGSPRPLELPADRPANTRLLRVPDHTDEWGIASACRVGVRMSTGDVILRLDADMVVFPEHVEAHARWHHEVGYAVTLGSKRFVDVHPDRPGWPSPSSLAEVGAERLFDPVASEPHAYVESIIARTDRLRAADHLAFLAHVGATVGMRRELYEAAGGYNASIRRGSDTEFGYRLAQAGALFVPEPAAGAWHLGPSSMMRDQTRLQRYSRPFLADAMPLPRWLRSSGGSSWAVPLVTVAMDVDGQPLELVRSAVDAVLGGDEPDVRVCLVGGWDKLAHEQRIVLDDPLLDLRLVAATYRSEPRVRLVDRAPETPFPSPYLVRMPVTAGLGRSAVRRLVETADRYGAGLVRASVDGADVELWRTAALGRARWVRQDGESLADVVAATYGVRTLRSLGSGGLPATVEVGGLRSWARATALVAVLAARRVWAAVRGGTRRPQ